ncbi:MAG: 30S ribosomal protein S2 [Candidatus Thermoplasmatota archaeon]|nr:30S ribosomal protein S2 [Candidatus Thermoplasmatota archaeon]
MAETIDEAENEGNGMLVSEEMYISSGAEIGTQQKTAFMKPFIAKVRNDGLYLIDIAETDRRIRQAARLLAQYDPDHVLAVAVRQYARKPLSMLAEVTGIQAMPGRFLPGTLTNPDSENYREPDVILLTDPIGDHQTLKEAVTAGIPVIALCDTNNITKYVDLVIPVNNKGRKSLALTYWLLAREMLKARGDIESNEEFELQPEDMEAEL